MTTLASAASASTRRRAWSRGVLAGPVCFLTAALVMCGGALWLPKGGAQIDNIVLPIVVFPVIWAALFFYTLLDQKLARAWAVTGLLFAAHAGWIAQHVLAEQAAAQSAAPAAAAASEGQKP